MLKNRTKPDLGNVKKPMTAMDLARLLGVSHATVSYVLNGQSERRKISPGTAARVFKAAETHNYIPNQLARSLKSQRSGMIGLVLGNFKMDWAEAVMTGIQKVLDETDYVPFVTTHGFDADRNRKEILSSLHRRDEGIIAFPLSESEEIYRSVIRSGVPLVFLGEDMSGLEEVSSVVWDSEAAAESGVQHLVDIGRKRIAFLGVDYPGLGTIHRFKAYCRVLEANGMPLRKKWIARPHPGLTQGEITMLAFDQFFSNTKATPDAIFALNDGLALPMLAELEARGISVPGEVAVMGMGDLPPSAHPAIGLSTLKEPTAEMGEAAAEILLGLILGKLKAPIRRTISSDKILVRRSTVGPGSN